MKRPATLGGALMVLASQVHAGVVDPGLTEVLRQAPAGEVVSTLVYLTDQVDLAATTHQLDV
ncbi:MAG: hypothetical protein ACYTBR_10060, partial [Planctomycetota bacterium]